MLNHEAKQIMLLEPGIFFLLLYVIVGLKKIEVTLQVFFNNPKALFTLLLFLLKTNHNSESYKSTDNTFNDMYNVDKHIYSPLFKLF